jgi:hypothetical protein
MAFRMGGLFIQARVENAAGTFEIGSNNGFVNSLNSISLTINSGGVSEIELSLSPTFQQAVEIIESGFLGYGHPIQSQGKFPNDYQYIKGVATPVKNLGISSSVQSSLGTSSKAASLAVRIGYGDRGANPSMAQTPWINGLITSPNLSFGQEISITMKAVSAGITLASSATTRMFNGQTLDSIIKKILKEDANCDVKFDSASLAKAQSILINDNQSDNSLAYIRMLLDQYNFKYFESGGTEKEPHQFFKVSDLATISNKMPRFTLVMYGQIDVNKRIYPCESFEADISHMFVVGSLFGQKATSTLTSTKETNQSKSDIDDYKKDIKAKGDTVGGRLRPGKPSSGGPTDGPPSLKDRTKAGNRKVIVKKDDNDKVHEETMNSQTKDAIDGSFRTTVTCPLIPEALPDELVKLIIFTGNTNKPILKSISGVYRVMTVKHSISDSGGTTQLDLLRGIGSASLLNENVQKVAQEIANSGSTSSASFKSLIKGIYG